MFKHWIKLCILLIASSVISYLKASTFDDLTQLSASNFQSHVGESVTFVMFYAPWCGHCQKLMPTWAEISQKYTTGTLKVAKVDCTTETKLCSDENIRGYPTLLLYDPNGGHRNKNGMRFTGERSLSAFNKFIEQNSNIEPSPMQVELDESVYILTKDNYMEVFKLGDAFVMFYVPWCKHCQKLKPIWEQLAIRYNVEERAEQTIIAKIDCTQHGSSCGELDVDSYPTLLYVKRGKVVAEYDGVRELKDLQGFVDHQYKQHVNVKMDETSGKVPLTTEDELDEEPLDVTGATFQETIDSTSLTFVKFYTPWCGHCKRLAPVWESLAKHYTRDSAVTIARVDCTEHNHICRAQQVDGFPTLRLYKNGKMIAQYSGDRSLPDLIKFIAKQSKDEL